MHIRWKGWFQNGTPRVRVEQIRCFVSASYVVFPLPALQVRGFPLRNRRSRPAQRAASLPYNSLMPSIRSLRSSRRQKPSPASPAHAHARLCADRRRLGAGDARQHARPDQRHHRAGRSRMAAQLGPRLGDGRVRHAAPLDGHAHAARERARQDRRAHARDSAAHRPQPALGGGHAGAGRAHGDSRLRRDPGRRRHAHGGHHRRGGGPGAGARTRWSRRER